MKLVNVGPPVFTQKLQYQILHFYFFCFYLPFWKIINTMIFMSKWFSLLLWWPLSAPGVLSEFLLVMRSSWNFPSWAGLGHFNFRAKVFVHIYLFSIFLQLFDLRECSSRQSEQFGNQPQRADVFKYNRYDNSYGNIFGPGNFLNLFFIDCEKFHFLWFSR